MRTGGSVGRFFALALAMSLAISSAAVAGPIFGRYTSTDIGGLVNVGLFSEGFFDIGNPYDPMNGAHAQDWDAATMTLGGMWEFSGATVGNPLPIFGDQFTATGTVVLARMFDVTNATFTLKDTGAWWNATDGAGQYVFNVTSYVQVLTLSLENFVIKEATSSEAFSATWNQNPDVKIINGQITGVYQGTGLLPINYPTYAPGTTTMGNFGVAEGLRFTIIPEPATMGLLALGLGGLLARRRRNCK